MVNPKEQQIIDFISQHTECSSKEIFDGLSLSVSYATLKRTLSTLISNHYLIAVGKGRAKKYSVSPVFKLIQPIDLKEYYNKDIDERDIKEQFDFSVINEVLAKYCVFTAQELSVLNRLQETFINNISQLSEFQYKKEFERLAIDLSWKSSQIEGNTYSLLETERLLKERETASGKTQEEAMMLLNHKETLDFILDNSTYLDNLTVAKIKNIHSIRDIYQS
ncbi:MULTISPECIES: hypothetical protein [Pasteurellaceae]|uniref:Uncharacterized protein n=1 Tax=Pasteurella atlantica TaxID=2827233 RepID=A0AAW8CKL8_9PAST|nr:hypothetical protein [Pasteurella atlantica]MBR0573836.1 hypothetical protein [Pasteurella atlantica]MDP8039228.1 hypothetical protein [Pasteurella atlantica]MDP8041319.1 hypothetical protein [Pasteurella atlantica]MDP8043455.1 hypothetical protein [Pasteurella atlantica]MDP8045626.1 hypothetical protein [Pasteurella atlantica]